MDTGHRVDQCLTVVTFSVLQEIVGRITRCSSIIGH